MTSFSHLYLFKGPISKYSPTLRYWGLALGHMNGEVLYNSAHSRGTQEGTPWLKEQMRQCHSPSSVPVSPLVLSSKDSWPLCLERRLSFPKLPIS
jgi:hypothetical protein